MILWKGYSAVAIWPFIFVRSKHEVSEELLLHERIHGAQQKEMLLIGFYLWYVSEWMLRLLLHGPRCAYRKISFEQEAYAHETEKTYIDSRTWYAWVKYVER